MKASSFCDILLPMSLFFTYTISLILAFISVLFMVRVITTRKYKTINPSDLYTDNFLKFDERVLQISLIKLYIKATENNKEKMTYAYHYINKVGFLLLYPLFLM